MLVIDIGNTNIVLGIYRDKKLLNKKRIESNKKSTFKDLKKFLINNKKFFLISDSNICIVSSVVPKLNTKIKKIILNFNLKIFFLQPSNFPFDIKIKYDLKSIGSDRIANTIALINSKINDSIIVDFGTATTFDVIKNRQYEGGLIFPGINISHDSLVRNAALLKSIKIIKMKNVVSNNSVESIQSGFYWGYVSVVNGLLKKIIKEKKFNPKIILTGGLANIFKSQIICNPKVNENLTLEGLRIIGKKINAK